MKNRIQHVLGTLFLLIAPAVNGQDFSCTIQGGQTLYFNINGENAIVTRPADSTLPYFSQLGNLAIPDTVEYNNTLYTINAIDSDAFARCSGLTQITIPVTVTTIGSRAFNSVPDLTRTNYTGTLAQWCAINFGSSSGNPISASGNLFVDGTAVTVNSFTGDIPEIKRLTFAGCTSLTGTLAIPTSTTKIGYGAFYLCTGITSVNLPSSLREIDNHAFHGCSNLISINLPEGLERIGDLAFFHCTNLQQVAIPRTVTYLGYNTFTNCSSLQSVWFNADSCRAGKIEDGLIYPIFGSSCTSLTSIVFGENVKIIPNYAFAFSRHITELVIPDSVTKIGKASFQTCDLLASVTLGKRVASIGDSAFGWCHQLWRFNMRGMTPPSYGFRSLHNIGTDVSVYVPCESVTAYENNGQWSMFDINGQVPYTLLPFSDDESKGIVSVIEQATCANPVATVKATALDGYMFTRWNDGNTDNPRQVVMNQDIILTAFFDEVSGIGEITPIDGAVVYTIGHDIVVQTKVDIPVYIFDIMGRNLAMKEAKEETHFSMPHSGVYIVRIGNVASEKVVVF